MRVVTDRSRDQGGGGDGLAASRRACAVLGVIWFVTAYVVVSLSMTKFHHYLLPALPGLAIVIGCVFADGGALSLSAPRTVAPLQLSPLAAVLIGLPLLAATSYDFLATPSAAARFLWLFSYDYVYRATGRPWPTTLDFRLGLGALAVIFALAIIALAASRTRRAGLVAWAIAAIASTAFLLDHFMPAVAPHWSQKPLIARYYQERRSPQEGLIAYQMFWRGETFYTKNAINEGPPEERTLFE
jgi:4-amino-4-deoxy-L-arabinose transferase-like glycosyltransferase